MGRVPSSRERSSEEVNCFFEVADFYGPLVTQRNKKNGSGEALGLAQAFTFNVVAHS